MNESARSVTSLELILFAATQVVSVPTEPEAGMKDRTLQLNRTLTPSIPS